MIERRWYVVNARNQVQLCESEFAARACVRSSDRLFPKDAPHRAVQMVEVHSAKTERLNFESRYPLSAELWNGYGYDDPKYNFALAAWLARAGIDLKIPTNDEEDA